MCCEKTCVRVLLVDLVDVLEREITQYHNLIDLLHQQSELLSAHDIELSAKVQKREDTVVLRIKMLEEGRKAIVSRISLHSGIPSEFITLKWLMKLGNSHFSQEYALCQSEMLSLIEKLESFDSIIASPIQEKLRYINHILRTFISANPAA